MELQGESAPDAASPTEDGLRAAVVILAGGMGSRMGAELNKVYLPIRGRHILDYSVETALSCEMVTHIVLVHRPEDLEQIERVVAACAARRPDIEVRTALGGESRHDSEYAGVAALRSAINAGFVDVVAVHDGARPFLSSRLLRRLLVGASTHGAVVPGLTVTDTLYAIDRHRFVDAADHVWVQTPQAFDARTLLNAHDAANEAGFNGVDTTEVVQHLSDAEVRVVDGEEANIKITYQTDLSTSEALAAAWESQVRTGRGDPGGA